MIKDFCNFYQSRRQTQTNFRKSSYTEKTQELKQKLKITTKSKEERFNDKIQQHKQLNTFVDITKFLSDMNIVNNEDLLLKNLELKEEYQQVRRRQNLQAQRQFQKQNQHSDSYGYYENLRQIKNKNKNLNYGQSLKNKENISQMKNLNLNLEEINNEQKPKIISLNQQEEISQSQYLDQILSDYEKKENKLKEKKRRNMQTFTQEGENATIKKYKQIQKKLKGTLSTQSLMNQEIKKEDYFNFFHNQSNKIISELKKIQMTERQFDQEARSNIQQYTKKVAQPRRLLAFYKLNPFTIKGLKEEDEKEKQQRKSKKFQTNRSSSTRMQLKTNHSNQSYNKFQKLEGDKENALCKIRKFITDIENVSDDADLRIKLQNLQEINELALYQDEQIESIRQINTKDSFNFRYKKQAI